MDNLIFPYVASDKLSDTSKTIYSFFVCVCPRFIQKHTKKPEGILQSDVLNRSFVTFYVAELTFNYCRYEAIVGIANKLLTLQRGGI